MDGKGEGVNNGGKTIVMNLTEEEAKVLRVLINYSCNTPIEEHIILKLRNTSEKDYEAITDRLWNKYNEGAIK